MQIRAWEQAKHFDLVTCAAPDASQSLIDLTAEYAVPPGFFVEDDVRAATYDSQMANDHLGKVEFLEEFLPLVQFDARTGYRGAESTRKRRREEAHLFRLDGAGNGTFDSRRSCFAEEKKAVAGERLLHDFDSQGAVVQLRQLWLSLKRQIRGWDWRNEDIAPLSALSARTILKAVPLPKVSEALFHYKLGKLSAVDVVGHFVPIIQPCSNFGLPPEYAPLRALLSEVIVDALRDKETILTWYAFELWARLTPAPQDCLDDMLDFLDEGYWLENLSKPQMNRVALLLSDVVRCIPETGEGKVIRDRLNRRLVEWSESEAVIKQQLFRRIVNDLYKWDFFSSTVDVEPSGQGRNRSSTTYPIQVPSRATAIETLFGGIDESAIVNWEMYAGISDHSRVKFEPSLFNAALRYCKSDVVRSVALWNLGVSGSTDPVLQESSYHAYHLSRDIALDWAGPMRRFIRTINGGFLQDYGPILGEDGKLMEQAAAKVVRITGDETLMKKLRARAMRLMGVDKDTAAETVNQAIAHMLTTVSGVKSLARLNLDRDDAYGFLAKNLRWRLYDGYRADNREKHALVKYAEKAFEGEVGIELDSASSADTANKADASSFKTKPAHLGYLGRRNGLMDRDVSLTCERNMLAMLGKIPSDKAIALFYRMHCQNDSIGATCLGVSVDQFRFLCDKGKKHLYALRNTLCEDVMDLRSRDLLF